MSVAIGAALILCFVAIEARARHPIMPLRLFADRSRTSAYIARMLFLGGMTGFWFFTTQLLQGVLGMSPALAGAAFLPTTIPNFLAAMSISTLSRRFGNGKLLGAGLLLSIAGIAMLSRVSADSSYLLGVALPMVLVCLGQGLSLAPLTVAGVKGVTSEDAGAASGVVNAAHQLGGTLGLGVMVVVFAAAAQGVPDAGAMLVHRIDAVFGAGTVMLVLAFLVALPLMRTPRAR
jgi:predicted MFS family arabinose efflux permease